MSWLPPSLPPLDRTLEPVLRARLDALTKPPGSLGYLEDVAVAVGVVQGTVTPVLEAGRVLVFAGDHGLAADGVSAYPQAVTAQMVLNFLDGGAAINCFAELVGLDLAVVDAGVAADLPSHPSLLDRKVCRGTASAVRGPAMTGGQVAACLEAGLALGSAPGAQALLPGEMGIGNTAVASLLLAALLDLPVDDLIGVGAGHDAAGLARKRDLVRQAESRHGRPADPLAALAAYGGCEIAMMAGAMLGAATQRSIVVVDGFIATAAAVVAERLAPGFLAFCVFAHASAESGHARVLAELGMRPLLDLGMRLGEGTGAALAWPLIVGATRVLSEMATFDSAGVSRNDEPVR